MWNNTCVLEVHRLGFNKKKTSCSGIIIDQRRGLIISHVSLLWPVLDPVHKSKLLSGDQLRGSELSQYKASIIVEAFRTFHESRELANRGYQSNNNTDASECQVNPNNCKQNDFKRIRRLGHLSGKVICIWKSASFENALQQMMPPSEGWKVTDDEKLGDADTNAKPTHSDTNEKKLEEADANDSFKVLPLFLMVQLDNELDYTIEDPRIQSPYQVGWGERLLAVGTPFGSLSPSVFINSVSEGVLSNVAGSEREMMLTDARAMPGTEGGGLYTANGELVGIIVASLCWKSNEWVGLSICCSLHAALSSLPHDSIPYGVDALHNALKSTQLRIEPKSGIASFAHLVVLVRCGGYWGTGVVVDEQQGVLLTCSHVVRGGKTVKVVRTSPRREVNRARVVFASPPGEVYDIAVLRLQHPWAEPQCEKQPAPYIRAPRLGEAVYAVGHACFSEQFSRQPSVTKGILSKVVCHQSEPVMLQSTCAVHGGASGGPLVGEDGTLVGLLACNAKDLASGSSYPHINMSIPMATVWSVVEKYLETKDEGVLRSLCIYENQVKAVWNLKEDLPELQSKL